jgi:large subunit ribosomal protein L15
MNIQIAFKTTNSLISHPVFANQFYLCSPFIKHHEKKELNSMKFDMHSLAPAKGSKKNRRRVARGYGGKGGGTGGRGTRGQKSRSGGGPRPGFEGGQLPLYRRLPKLKGIAGGMSRGSTDFTIVNLAECDRAFSQNETVSLEELKRMRIINCSGRDRLLPLKVLGNGSLSSPLLVKAAGFSASAKSAIEMAGGKAELIK